MLGIFKRNKERRHSPGPMDVAIERNQRALDTAVELLQRFTRGELPPKQIVEIGDGFYVEQNPDGSRNTVVLDRSKIPVARLERHVARVDGFSCQLPTQQQVDEYRARINEYARRAEDYAREHLTPHHSQKH